MKFNKVNYDNMKLDETSEISKTYVTAVQRNRFHQVTITDEQRKKSVKVLSRLNKN